MGKTLAERRKDEKKLETYEEILAEIADLVEFELSTPYPTHEKIRAIDRILVERGYWK